MVFWSSAIVVALATLSTSVDCKELEYPPVLDLDCSTDTNRITLDFDWLEVDPGFEGGPFQTRALGGSVPGPTIKLCAGTTLEVEFRNLLTEQPNAAKETDPNRVNLYNDPDTANLHFHGGHVSSVLPADDTTLAVPPGESYNFSVPFPADHMPGLHWVHPHHHGSSSLHLVGGAALALIVKDLDGSLPAEIADAKERVMVFQDWDIVTAIVIAKNARDANLEASFSKIEGGEDVGGRFITVNGMYQPTLTVTQGVWERWRILYAGWQDLALNLVADEMMNEAGCEFQLLAKDGIYIEDFPRHIEFEVPVPPGGRADLMVRCNNAGTTDFWALSRPTFTVVSESSSSSDVIVAQGRSDAVPSLTPWAPTAYPDYLQSVEETTASPGCTCPVKLDGYDDTGTINGKRYRSGNNFLHTSYLGAVVERELKGIYEHSYHQHIYPFQLIGGFDETEYFQYGDWHDTLLNSLSSTGTTHIIRYRTTDIPGKLIVHCHNTMHADWGMMAKEYVRDVSGGECACDLFSAISGPGLVDDVELRVIVGAEVAEETSSSSGASAHYIFHSALWLCTVLFVVTFSMI